MTESWETKVLRDETERIERAIIPELRFVAQELNKAYLLSDDELCEIKAAPTDVQRASMIVDSLKRAVKINSKNYEKFVNILEQKPQFFESILHLITVREKEILGEVFSS